MPVLRKSQWADLGFLISLMFAVSFCHGNKQEVLVVGTGECAGCDQSNINTKQAFSGLGVTIECKVDNGELKTMAVGELDGEGKFKLTLPEDLVKKDGKLEEECYVQLRSASGKPCSEGSKIVLKNINNGKHVFAPSGKLKFSPLTCTSAFFWPHDKHFPIPKSLHWPKPIHKFFSPPSPYPAVPEAQPSDYYPPQTPSVPPSESPSSPRFYDDQPSPEPAYYYPAIPPAVPVYGPPLPSPVSIHKKPPFSSPPPPVPVHEKPYPPPFSKKPPLPSAPPPVPVHEKPYPPPFSKKPPLPSAPPPVPVHEKPYLPPPPLPVLKNPIPPPVPVHKNPPLPPLPPLPPPVPPPVTVHKKPALPPFPPPVPAFKKPDPPPPLPKLKKPPPSPPPIPTQKSIPPISKPSPTPEVLPAPFSKNPLLPPIPKAPALPDLPPLPKTPPKYFYNPKHGMGNAKPPLSSHP